MGGSWPRQYPIGWMAPRRCPQSRTPSPDRGCGPDAEGVVAEVGEDVHGVTDDAPGLGQRGPVAVAAVTDRGVVVVCLARTEFVGPTVTVLSGSALESGWSMGVTDVFGPTERHAGWVCQL